MVRSVSVNDNRSQGTPTPTHWDDQTVRPPSRGSNARTGSVPPNVGRDRLAGMRDSQPLSDRYTAASTRHARSDSEATGVASSGGYPETTQSGPPRRHDYDVQAMETSSPARVPSLETRSLPRPSPSGPSSLRSTSPGNSRLSLVW